MGHPALNMVTMYIHNLFSGLLGIFIPLSRGRKGEEDYGVKLETWFRKYFMKNHLN